jgi:superfamily II DNA/RNA helicase
MRYQQFATASTDKIYYSIFKYEDHPLKITFDQIKTMNFEDLGLSPSLTAALESQKLKDAYPIQEQVIPAVLARKDVLGIAKTGSGKTLSYVLPLLMNLQGNTEVKNRHV